MSELFAATIKTSRSNAQRMYCAKFIEVLLQNHMSDEINETSAESLAEGVQLVPPHWFFSLL